MKADELIPPLRELPPGHLALRALHLRAAIAEEPGRSFSRWRLSNPRLRMAAVVALILLVALVVLTSALAVDRDLWHTLVGTPVDKAELARENRAALARIGASGKHVDLRRRPTSREAVHFNRMLQHLGDIRLIAHREGRSFYVIEPRKPGVARCFAIGRDGQPQPGGILCVDKQLAARFPSPRYPMLDMSTIGADRTNPAMRVIALEGFAADAIKSVAVRVGLKIEAETPVVDNVYVRTSGLPDKGGEIVALDENDHVIGCAPPGCS